MMKFLWNYWNYDKNAEEFIEERVKTQETHKETYLSLPTGVTQESLRESPGGGVVFLSEAEHGTKRELAAHVMISMIHIMINMYI